MSQPDAQTVPPAVDPDDAVVIVEAINELREYPQSFIGISADGCDGRPGVVVDVCSDWTFWQVERFEGDTLRLALESARHAMAVARRQREEDLRTLDRFGKKLSTEVKRAPSI